MITSNQSLCLGSWCKTCRFSGKLSKVTAKDLVVFHLQHCYGLERAGVQDWGLWVNWWSGVGKTGHTILIH